MQVGNKVIGLTQHMAVIQESHIQYFYLVNYSYFQIILYIISENDKTQCRSHVGWIYGSILYIKMRGSFCDKFYDKFRDLFPYLV